MGSEKYTATPWELRDFGRGLILVSEAPSKPIVMDFVRKGMNGAEPRFGKRTDSMGGIMVPLSEWKEAMPPDLEFILHAVNSHAVLVDALREAKDLIKIWHGNEAWDIYDAHSPEMARINNAIARAESGSETDKETGGLS